MTTSELFKKHFGDKMQVDLKHPNVENFFEELNAICLAEDEPTGHGKFITYLNGVEQPDYAESDEVENGEREDEEATAWAELQEEIRLTEWEENY